MILEDNIQALIKILEASTIDEIEVSTFWGKQKIRIRRSLENSNKNIEIVSSGSPRTAKETPETNLEPTQDKEIEKGEYDSLIGETILKPEVAEKTISIKAPLVGTFYRSSKPGSPAFIEEGDIIKMGEVVCIIEAMKIYNEIESDISGKVSKILIKDGTPVEYDQELITVILS